MNNTDKYKGLKATKEMMNKSYFDLLPVKVMTKDEAKAIYPPREDYPFDPLSNKSASKGVLRSGSEQSGLTGEENE